MAIIYRDSTGKVWNRKPIFVTGTLVFNPTEEQLEQAGYTKEDTVQVAKVKAPSLENTRKKVLFDAENYFRSTAVLGFYFNGKLTWISSDDRVKLREMLESLKRQGCVDREVRFEGYRIPVETALDYLDALSVYTFDCYTTYQDHLEVIKDIETIEGLESYDFTTDYPEQLEINL